MKLTENSSIACLRRVSRWFVAGPAVAMTISSVSGAARADAPPSGWHTCMAPPASTSRVFAIDLAPGFEVLGALDVRTADLPLAAEGQGKAPALRVTDSLAPFPRDWQPGVHGVMQFTVMAWTGLVRLNDEEGAFGPSTWWSMGVKHNEESTAKNTGPFSFEALTGFDSLQQYSKPSPARFDHVEGTVEPDFSTRTSRWLSGDAVPTAWETARAIRIPGPSGESVAVFVGSFPVVLGGADHDSSAMIFLEEDARAKLGAHGVEGARDWTKSLALVIDVSSDPADPVVRFRAVGEPLTF